MMIGLYIIGDEILSGRRLDQHMSRVIDILKLRGLELAWAQYLGDERALLELAFRRSFASSDLVFSCGGIGGTPDDHTRQAVAAALGVPLHLHPQAEDLIRQRCERNQVEATVERLRMGEFPEGAKIIPNPHNQIPGFSVGNHYFVPGFPVMAWPMIEWVLDTYYPAFFGQHRKATQSMLVYQLMEATLTPLMEKLEREFTGVRVFSLPSLGEDGRPRHIDLGVKGQPEQVPFAYDRLRRGVLELGGVIGDENIQS